MLYDYMFKINKTRILQKAVSPVSVQRVSQKPPRELDTKFMPSSTLELQGGQRMSQSCANNSKYLRFQKKIILYNV